MPVIHVQQYQLDSYWPHILPMLEKAMVHAQGEMNCDQMRYMLTKGMGEMFVAQDGDKIDGVAVVEFINYPNFRVASVVAIGGKGVVRYWEDFKNWLRMGGASYVEGHCYDSISRLWESKLGMKKVYTIMRGEL